MIESLLYFVIEVAVLGMIFWLLTWTLGQIPIPEPIRTVIRVVIVVVSDGKQINKERYEKVSEVRVCC